MNLLEKALPRLRNVLDQIHSLVKGLHFDPQNQQHLLAGALLGRILEQAEGILTILEQHNGACGFILLRSLLEAYVDLRNTVAESVYVDFMYATWLNEQKRLGETALEKGSQSPFLARFSANRKEAAEQLSWLRTTLKELKDRQVTPLTVKERFKRADQLDYYEGPYAHMCWHSHNNVNVLESRHLRTTDAGIEIRAFTPIEDTDAQLISDTTAVISADSLAAVKLLLEGEPLTGLEDLRGALEKLRELWSEGSNDAD